MNAPIYQLEGIGQVYGGRRVLDVDRLSIEPHSITGLMGPNGSGKSTLMRILAFVEAPAEGRMFFQGQLMSHVNLNARHQVAMLFQEPYLLKRSVETNVAYGLKVRGMANHRGRVHEALERVGLDPVQFAHRSWRELSGGEAQRVALAARLVFQPEVLLLDEPTASVDRKSSHLIQHAVVNARNQWGTTLIISSHNVEWVTQVADRIFSMDDGRLAEG